MQRAGQQQATFVYSAAIALQLHYKHALGGAFSLHAAQHKSFQPFWKRPSGSACLVAQVSHKDGHILQLAAVLLAQLQPQLLQPLLAAAPGQGRKGAAENEAEASGPAGCRC